MKVSASIELAWKIASQEAITMEHEEIEPEHFLEALLKMMEIPIFQYNRMGLPEPLIRQLGDELQSLCSEVHALGIDGKDVRQKIKERLGKGNHPFKGGTMHRSRASRELFDRMATVAADEGTEVITLKHMMKALVESLPSSLLGDTGMEVFPNLPDPRFEKGKKASGKKAETPFLDEYGRDLKKQALDAKSPIKPERKAESLALTNALSAPSRKSVLFICDSFETVRAIVIGALYSALSQKNKHLFKERRIDDISFFKVDEDDEQRTRLQRILTEMDKRQDLILMLPSLDRHAYSREKKEGWVDILQTVLRRGNNQVICHTTPDVYEDFIKKDSGLIKLFHRLWISKENSKDIPYEI